MQKQLICIGGPMGVGKTTVCRQMQARLDHCVFLDGAGDPGHGGG